MVKNDQQISFCRIIIKALFYCAFMIINLNLSFAQQEPALLIQGKSVRKCRILQIGQTIELQLKGEPDFFKAKINNLYPESQALLIDDLLISTKEINAIKVNSKAIRLKQYLKIQGFVNLGLIGIVSAADKNVRKNQSTFALGSAIASGAMVLYGYLGNKKTKIISPKGSYVLQIIGGDLRKTDSEN